MGENIPQACSIWECFPHLGEILPLTISNGISPITLLQMGFFLPSVPYFVFYLFSMKWFIFCMLTLFSFIIKNYIIEQTSGLESMNNLTNEWI
jgi:hypothetical protein